MTSVFVTHDQEEALEVADRVVVMNRGSIEQIGAPDEVYDRPATPFVYEFMGQVNRFPVPGEADASGFARPHEIAVLARPDAAALPARLVHSAAIGPVARLEFALDDGGQIVSVELPRTSWSELGLGPGAVAYLKPTQLRRFDLPT